MQVNEAHGLSPHDIEVAGPPATTGGSGTQWQEVK